MTGFAGLRPLPYSIVIAGVATLLGTMAGFEPVLALGLALGLAFVALVLTNLLAGLCLFTLVTFLEVLPTLSQISVAKAVGLVLVASWLATMATRREASHSFLTDHPVATYLAMLFLLWVTATAVWADDPTRVIGDLARYGPNILLIGIVYAAIRDRRSTIIVVSTFVVGALFSAVYGIVGIGAVNEHADPSRLGGGYGNPNALALILIGASTLAVGLAALRSQPPLARLASAIGALVCGYALLGTSSRMGLVGLGTALVLGIVFAGRRRHAPMFALALIAALTVGVYMVAVAPPQARERILKSDGGSGRTDLWRVGWRMVEDKPLQGVGAGNFSLVSVQYVIRPGYIDQPSSIIDTPKVPHNIYLQVLAELGAIGLLLFLSIIGFTLRCAARAARLFSARGDPTMEIISRALFVATGGMLVAAVFSSQLFSKPLWLLMAISPALFAIARANAPARRDDVAGAAVA